MIAALIIAGLAVGIAYFLRWTIALSQGGCLPSIAAVVFALLGLAMALALLPLAAGLGGWEGWVQP